MRAVVQWWRGLVGASTLEVIAPHVLLRMTRVVLVIDVLLAGANVATRSLLGEGADPHVYDVFLAWNLPAHAVVVGMLLSILASDGELATVRGRLRVALAAGAWTAVVGSWVIGGLSTALNLACATLLVCTVRLVLGGGLGAYTLAAIVAADVLGAAIRLAGGFPDHSAIPDFVLDDAGRALFAVVWRGFVLTTMFVLASHVANRFRSNEHALHLRAAELERRLAEQSRLFADSPPPAGGGGSATETAPVESHEVTLPAAGPRAAPVTAGTRLGRYEIVGLLGTGAMGAVYEARDPELDRNVAVKVVHPRPGDAERARVRLRREAQTMARLSHPNVATVFDIGLIGEQLFVAMEHVRGDTLRACVGPSFAWRDQLATLLAAGRGLAAAHAAGVIHRDFKPDNVLVRTDGAVRVSDFGLAREPSGPEVAVDGAAQPIAGTPAYLAPECYRGASDPATDQFAFAVTAFEVFEGVRPFEASAVAAYARGDVRDLARRPWRRTELPLALRSAIERGLALDPAARWPSVEALGAALARSAATTRTRWPWAVAASATAGIAALLVAAPSSTTAAGGADVSTHACRPNVPVTLVPGTIYPGGRDPWRVAIGHIDLDATLDVASVYGFSKTLSIWFGKGNTTLVEGPTIEVGGGAISVAVGNFNGDHRPDLAILAYKEVGSELAILLGHGRDGRFAPAIRTSAGCTLDTTAPSPHHLVLRDFDADGHTDAAIANRQAGVCLLYGRGDGTFDRRQHVALPGQPWSLAALDLDADGRQDLVASTHQGGAVLLRNVGTELVVHAFVPAGTDSRGVATGDLDRDGRDDFVVAHPLDHQVSVHLAADRFRATFYPTLPFPDFVGISDLNGDCQPDVALTYSAGFTASESFTVLRGDGAGRLRAAEHQGGGHQKAFAIGDLDGDGRPDVVLNQHVPGAASGTAGVTVLRNVTP